MLRAVNDTDYFERPRRWVVDHDVIGIRLDNPETHGKKSEVLTYPSCKWCVGDLLIRLVDCFPESENPFYQLAAKERQAAAGRHTCR